MMMIRALVGVQSELHSNGADYLKNFGTNWTFLNFNSNKIYDKATNVL